MVLKIEQKGILALSYHAVCTTLKSLLASTRFQHVINSIIETVADDTFRSRKVTN